MSIMPVDRARKWEDIFRRCAAPTGLDALTGTQAHTLSPAAPSKAKLKTEATRRNGAPAAKPTQRRG